MDGREKYEYWLDIAFYDFETAGACLASGRYLYVVFLCQQAIEKLVKGLHVLYLGKEADRTHNIARVFAKIMGCVEFQAAIKREEIVTDIYNEFFAELLYYYISERYPSYKDKLSSSVDKKMAQEVYLKTEEVFLWLQSLIQYKG